MQRDFVRKRVRFIDWKIGGLAKNKPDCSSRLFVRLNFAAFFRVVS
jgi:hypothetical protein